MNHPISTRLGITLVVFALVAISCGDATPAADGSSNQTDVVTTPSGPPAPDLPFTYWDGTEGTFADFEGTPVVVNFWASWCPACVTEMPDFERAHTALGGDVAFLGLATSDAREPADALVADLGISYTLAEDLEGDLFLAFEGFAMPTTIFINAAGEVVHRHNGVLFEEELLDKINEFLLTS